jgi:DNA polymerase I-like protein with 3'-5' exonuclease and polymerase domains
MSPSSRAPTPAHDKLMAKAFLAAHEPNTEKFIFRFRSDDGGNCNELAPGTVEEIWPIVLDFNTSKQRVGVFLAPSDPAAPELRLPGTLDFTDPAKPRLARGGDDPNARLEGGNPLSEFSPIADEVLEARSKNADNSSAKISTRAPQPSPFIAPVATDWRVPSKLPDLRHVKEIAIDTEIKDDGLRADRGSAWPWRGGHICGVSVAYRADGNIRSHYFPIRHPDTENFDPKQLHQWVRDHIAAGLKFITLNGIYDWGWLRTEAGIKMPPAERLEEIGALATIVDENRYQYGLDALCKWRGLPGKDVALLEQAAKAAGFKVNKKTPLQSYIWQLPARYVGAYAERDPAAALALYEDLNSILDKEGTRDAYRLEVDLLPMVLEMRLRGGRIDQSAIEQARDYCLQKRDVALAELSEKLERPVSMHEIGRNKWLAETFDQLGIAYPRTAKGNPSFTGGQLGWMRTHLHWLPPLIAKADKYNKAATNFLQGLLDHAVNGRIHAEIHPHRSEDGGTKSVRFSYSDPSLQQMPSRDPELGPLIRSVFLPEEGEFWAESDVSQQEFRFVVHYAHQHGLRKSAEAVGRYRADPDADFHALVAAITGLDRTSAKAVNFAKIYGAGPAKFAQMIGKPLAQAQQIYDQYDRELPFLRELSKICTGRARQQGFITLYDGTRRHFDKWAPGGAWKKGAGPCELEEAQRRLNDPSHPWYQRRPLYRADIHTALNALIQGSAARHTKLWMRACWREGIVPLLQMHDALECSVSSLEQAELVARLGEEAVQLDVPMRVDLKFGHTWGDAKHTWEELHGIAPAIVVAEVMPIQPQDGCLGDTEVLADSGFRTSELLSGSESEHKAVHAENGVGGDAPTAAQVNVTASASESEEEDVWAAFEKRWADLPEEEPASGADGSRTEAARDTHAEKHDGKPFNDAFLRYNGYHLADVFDYTLADGTLLYRQNRYELNAKIAPTKELPSKRFLPHRGVNGKEIFGAGDRRVIYNWPAVMRAGPGATVIVAEGENKAKILNDNGLLATTVLSHKWAPECVAALTGCHLFILQDHDKDGEKLANNAQRNLAPVAASTRIVPAPHLWKHLPNEARGIKPGDDVKDWIELGGDPERLLDICREIPADSAELGEWDAGDDTTLPQPRRWLTAGQFCRTFLSGLVAPGATGKTALRILQALALATGKPLAGQHIYRRCRVLIISFEDDAEELRRRILAACLHYKISLADVKGWLFPACPKGLKLMEMRDGERATGMLEPALRRAIERRQPDLVILDPFVKLHALEENDNAAMDAVADLLTQLAREYDIAMDSPAHTRKGLVTAGDADVRRGASAVRDAGRLDYTLIPMSEDEAKAFGIALEERREYLRLDSAKVNLLPPARTAQWFKLISVPLGNTTPDYPDGDYVQTLEPWKPPEILAGFAPEAIEATLEEIEAGLPSGQRYSSSPGATSRAAWPVVQKYCPTKTEAQCREVVRLWLKTSILREDDYDDPVDRKPRKGLRLNRTKQPV